ncbi:MAG: glycosyltransferase, partial [Treponema sp.]|nr:glycosyltransferase [Treponema sp.]
KISPEKIKIIAPYFDDFSNVNHSFNTKNIIFYGAMSRPENYECCIWFIENVFNKLSSNFTMTIIGANPHPSLLNYKSERIIITGFVKDARPYFETALCSVVPLLLGAGIKIKVLESMSAGIPVLTNAIGIEGIPAKNKVDYLHCETAQDYISSITELADNYEMQKSLSENARNFISRNFNYQNDSYV